MVMMKTINLRFIYLYLFTAIGLIITVIGLITGINLALKAAFFKEADIYNSFYPTYSAGDAKLSREELDQQKADFEKNSAKDQTRNRQRELANTIAMIVVGAPLYMYHWKMIQKDNGKR